MALFSKGTEKIILYGAGIAALVIGYGVYKTGKRVGDIVKTDLNPASRENIAYKGVNKLGETVTGKNDFDLGDWVYCKLNPNAIACNPDLAAVAQEHGLSYFDDTGHVNPQLVLLYEQQKDFD